METIPCPGCGLPRAVEEPPDSPCPVCSRKRSDPPVLEEVPVERLDPVPVVLASQPVGDYSGGAYRNWLILGATVLSLALVVGLLLWSRYKPGLAEQTTPSPPPSAPTPVRPEPAPSPRPGSLALTENVPGPPELAPLPRESFLPAGPYAVLRLDRPTADYKLDRLGEGNRLKLVGRVKRLLIEGLEGGAALDASELNVQDVFFYGKVEGNSTAVVRSADGAVLFRDEVTGHSRVLILPGTDFVSFAAVPTWSKPGSQIAAGARVQITAKAVHFAAPITGPDTTVEVTLVGNGTLRFATVDRAAKLFYRSANPDGPPPRVHAGDVRGGAESKYVQ